MSVRAGFWSVVLVVIGAWLGLAGCGHLREVRAERTRNQLKAGALKEIAQFASDPQRLQTKIQTMQGQTNEADWWISDP
jgi:hypothetical protein